MIVAEESTEEPQISGSGYLLASGSRDRTIRLWSWTRGKAAQFLKLPVNTGYKRDRHDENSRSRVWLTLYWPQNKPTKILSSTHGLVVLSMFSCQYYSNYTLGTGVNMYIQNQVNMLTFLDGCRIEHMVALLHVDHISITIN